MTDFKIRQATLSDMDYVMTLVKNEGWNPGINDGRCFYAADSKGFWIGELAGRQIGCVSGVRYKNTNGRDFAFIGCYIVEPGFRGNIHGAVMGKHVMDLLSDCNIGIDGVLAQQEHYKHFGFKLEHRNLRFVGDCSEWPALELGAEVIDARALDIEMLLAYDRLHFPADRVDFLKNWINTPTHHALAYVENGEVSGYAVARKCTDGYKVGPLFAANSKIAECLLLSLARDVRYSEAGGAELSPLKIYLDISEENLAARSLVEKMEMQFVFETARMYSAGKPDVNWQEVYGITTFELG